MNTYKAILYPGTISWFFFKKKKILIWIQFVVSLSIAGAHMSPEDSFLKQQTFMHIYPLFLLPFTLSSLLLLTVEI